MHLNQEQVKALLPYLQHFAETGELPNDNTSLRRATRPAGVIHQLTDEKACPHGARRWTSRLAGCRTSGAVRAADRSFNPPSVLLRPGASGSDVERWHASGGTRAAR